MNPESILARHTHRLLAGIGRKSTDDKLECFAEGWAVKIRRTPKIWHCRLSRGRIVWAETRSEAKAASEVVLWNPDLPDAVLLSMPSFAGRALREIVDMPADMDEAIGHLTVEEASYSPREIAPSMITLKYREA